SRPGFGWQSVRLFLGSMLRALGLLLGKAPADAWDEVVGTIRAYARPLRMLHARRVRRSTAEPKPAEVRHLLPATWWPYQHGLDLAVETVRAVVRPQPAVAARRALVEPGPEAPEAENLADEKHLLLRRPWLTTVGVLIVLAAVAGRGLYGGGNLFGGALLPAPSDAGHWWQLLFEPWHQIGVGSAKPAPPYVLALAV